MTRSPKVRRGSYPESTIWYVEASSDDQGYRSRGSAVAVSIQKTGHPETRKKYLLTCAHVVRGAIPGSIAPDKEVGLGPLMKYITVWEPYSGYPGAKRDAQVAHDIRPIQPTGVSDENRKNAADDWVVLEIKDSQVGSTIPVVKVWGDATEGEICVWGYPGGDESFSNSNVVPTCGERLRFRDHFHGVVRINGLETRAGMSGGGVFDAQNQLVGLHRARQDPVLQCHSVSITSIREKLADLGFEPADIGVSPLPPRRLWSRVLATVVLIVCGLLVRAYVLPSPPPPPPPQELELAQILQELGVLRDAVIKQAGGSEAQQKSNALLDKKVADLENRAPFRLVKCIIAEAQPRPGQEVALYLVPPDKDYWVKDGSVYRLGVLIATLDQRSLPRGLSIASLNPQGSKYRSFEAVVDIDFVDWSPTAICQKTLAASAEDLQLGEWTEVP